MPRKLLKGGNYSREETICGNTVCLILGGSDHQNTTEYLSLNGSAIMGPDIPGDTSEGYCAVRLDNGRIMIMSSTRGIWNFSLSPNITATDPTKLKDDNQN